MKPLSDRVAQTAPQFWMTAEVRSHGAVQAAFGIRFATTARLDPRLHRWLLDAFDLRLLADYDPMWTLEAESIRETVEQAVT